ncbi:hypothetical protein ACHAXT_006259 [Thalassiosira profunda]
MPSSAAAACYCGSASSASRESSGRKLLCHHCAARRLASQIQRYNSVQEKREVKREECHHRLLETRLRPLDASIDVNSADGGAPLSSRQPLPDPNQINQQVSQLKQRLDTLRSQSNELAVRVTAKTVENDEREEQLRMHSEKVQMARERLERMRQCLLEPTDPNASNDGYQGVGGGLKDALIAGSKHIQTLRFHFACRVFDMHRLDVGEQYTKRDESKEDEEEAKKRDESATGVGKIGGLPLPHAGPALYGVIPPMILASSLRLVASLTQMVARCLGVVLPHPILVCFKECKCGAMYDFGGDVIDMAADDNGGCDEEDDVEYLDESEHSLCSACRNKGSDTGVAKWPQPAMSMSSSGHSQRRSSLLKFVGSSARKAMAITSSATRAIAHNVQQSTLSLESSQSGFLPPQPSSLDAQSAKSSSSNAISNRISHASFAYLRENYDKAATEYVLYPPRMKEGGTDTSKSESGVENGNTRGDQADGTPGQAFSSREEFHVAEEKFNTGMQLLQNDVVALCFRAGEDVSTLWPAESVLLNLYSLLCHCRKMADPAR